MSCIVLEKDDHSRRSIQLLLSELGYNPIYTTGNLKKFEHFLGKFGAGISMIVSGLDIELTQIAADSVSHNSQLFLTPLIHLINGWSWPSSRSNTGHSRIDNWISRPLSLETFRDGIQTAQFHRAQKRSTLLVYSDRQFEIDPTFKNNRTTHWQTIVATPNAERFFEEVFRLQSSIGGILIDPKGLDSTVIDWLRRFKKTPLGLVTPIAALSRDPKVIHEIRTLCEVFFETLTPSTLNAFSKRSVFAWAARDIIRECRKSIRDGQLRRCAQVIKSGLRLDDRRFEYHEIAGLLARQVGQTKLAIHHFKLALQDNPCSPFPYLNLLHLIEDKSELDLIMQMGIGFCPAHPQLISMIRAIS